jgi:peptidoglycan hydrolase-like protein with peptidoglycan-binding domain
MKKLSFLGFAFVLFTFFASNAHALTPPRPDVMGNQSVILDMPKGKPCYAFTRGLGWGMRNSEVISLQQVLNADIDTQVAVTGSGSIGNETEFYGYATMRAVAKFQKKYGISPSGYVGPMTRAKLMEKFGCNAQTLKVTSPDRTDTWPVSWNGPIMWNGAKTDFVKISIIKNLSGCYHLPAPGKPCLAVVDPIAVIASSTPNDGSYTWSIGQVVADSQFVITQGSNYFIKVCEVGGSDTCGVSEEFTITKPSTLKVTEPNGVKWFMNDQETIRWSGSESSEVSIHLKPYVPCQGGNCPSVDFGTGFTIVSSTYNKGSFTWKVGTLVEKILLAPQGEQYVITVCERDTSHCAASKPFKLQSATASKGAVRVTVPNGGNTWVMEQNSQLKWEGGSSSKVKITLEHYYPQCDGPVCPMFPYEAGFTIANSAANTGSYDWKIGRFVDAGERTVRAGTGYVIRICEIGGGGSCDQSDGGFNMIAAGTNF